MKRLIVCLMIVGFILSTVCLTYAADSKITALTEDTSPTTDDLVVTVDDPSGTPTNKKVTLDNLLSISHDFYLGNENYISPDSTTSGNSFSLRAYDNDDSVWRNALTITNGDTPSVTLGTGCQLDGIDTLDMGSGVLILPFDESADASLTTPGQVHIRGDEDSISFNAGTNGEVSGEVLKSMLDMVQITFDPSWAYDQESTNRSVPVLWINPKLFPNGITIDYWKIEYNKDPTTELDADLMRSSATDWKSIDPSTDTVMDALDTTAGVASEDIDANINSGAVVAAGDRIYIHFGSDPTDDNVMVTFTMIYHAEED